jgi:general secretion pathway protein I
VQKNKAIGSGFTLLEVMVALAVAAIGLGAVAKSMTVNVDVSIQIKLRTLGTWVASNRMAELRMYRQFNSAGGGAGLAKMGGLDWRLEELYSTTPDPDISRIDINVFQDPEGRAVASLTGYIGRYKPGE